uniref:Uncharacterized protein n=1 Tax=Rhizophora mucronata TaxID=61149 RepID=A0A2P2QX39_RHIMU
MNMRGKNPGIQKWIFSFVVFTYQPYFGGG